MKEFTEDQINSGLYFTQQYVAESRKEIPVWERYRANRVLNRLKISPDYYVSEYTPIYFDVQILIGEPGYRNKVRQSAAVVTVSYKDVETQGKYVTLTASLSQNEYVLLTKLFNMENCSI